MNHKVHEKQIVTNKTNIREKYKITKPYQDKNTKLAKIKRCRCVLKASAHSTEVGREVEQPILSLGAIALNA